MTELASRLIASSSRAALVAIVLATSGCAGMMNTPSAQSIADLPPAGSVTITEDFVSGVGVGNGTLAYQGQTYPFKVFGSVVGPGGVEKISASGPVYKLASVADFPGRYTQSTGKAGFTTSGKAPAGWDDCRLRPGPSGYPAAEPLFCNKSRIGK
jgi:hypothetical protein